MLELVTAYDHKEEDSTKNNEVVFLDLQLS